MRSVIAALLLFTAASAMAQDAAMAPVVQEPVDPGITTPILGRQVLDQTGKAGGRIVDVLVDQYGSRVDRLFFPLRIGGVDGLVERLNKFSAFSEDPVRASATSSANVTAQQAKKKHVQPVINPRKKRVIVGRASIDIDLLRQMIAAGKTQTQCAEHFGASVKTIQRRLVLKSGLMLVQNTNSKFNVQIADRNASDRTNSIAGRV